MMSTNIKALLQTVKRSSKAAVVTLSSVLLGVEYCLSVALTMRPSFSSLSFPKLFLALCTNLFI